MTSIPSPSIAVNAPSSNDPEPLLSPTGVSIHCVESMFPDEHDGFQTSAIDSQVRSLKTTHFGFICQMHNKFAISLAAQEPSSDSPEIVSTCTANFEDARSTVTLTDIEERLRTASMSGSIHELQEEVASRKSSRSASEVSAKSYLASK